MGLDNKKINAVILIAIISFGIFSIYGYIASQQAHSTKMEGLISDFFTAETDEDILNIFDPALENLISTAYLLKSIINR